MLCFPQSSGLGTLKYIQFYFKYSKEKHTRNLEMSQWLRAFDTLAEDPHSAPNTHTGQVKPEFDLHDPGEGKN